MERGVEDGRQDRSFLSILSDRTERALGIDRPHAEETDLISGDEATAIRAPLHKCHLLGMDRAVIEEALGTGLAVSRPDRHSSVVPTYTQELTINLRDTIYDTINDKEEGDKVIYLNI